MKIIDNDELKKYNNEDYIWYGCYGSNINYKRFMYYINGDSSGKYSTIEGCMDKTEPVEYMKYIFKCPIYFAACIKRWDGGGVAFLDYESHGYSYGKIYKIKMSQFKDILKQEQKCEFYNTILIVDYVDNIPVFTFTSMHKLNDKLNEPSNSYIAVIKEGILDLYEDINSKQIEEYLTNNNL